MIKNSMKVFLFISVFAFGFIPSVSEAQIVSNVISLDKESYEFGETVEVKYISQTATNVNVALYDFKGKFISNIKTNLAVNVGENKISYFIPAIGPDPIQDLFVIRVNETNTTKSSQSRKFSILPSYMQVTRESSEAYTLFVPNQPERGIFIQTLKLKAIKGDVFIKSQDLPDISVLTDIPNNSVKIAGKYREILTPVMAQAKPGVYIIPKGREALIKFTVIAAPVHTTDVLRMKVNSVSTSSDNGLQRTLWYKGMQEMVSQSLLVKDELF